MRAEAPKRSFDAAGFKGGFPGLADPRLHYLDNAATAQMPEVVFDALRRFEVEARANVHEGMHARARAATDAYNQARARVARFLHANSDQEVVFAYGTTSSINLLAHSFGARLQPGDEILLSILEHHSNLVPWQRLAQRQGVVLSHQRAKVNASIAAASERRRAERARLQAALSGDDQPD